MRSVDTVPTRSLEEIGMTSSELIALRVSEYWPVAALIVTVSPHPALLRYVATDYGKDALRLGIALAKTRNVNLEIVMAAPANNSFSAIFWATSSPWRIAPSTCW